MGGVPPCTIFFQKKIIIIGPAARKQVGSKNSPKRSFFGLKNSKIFESNIHFFLVGTKNHPINETEKALFNRNRTKKNKIAKNSKILEIFIRRRFFFKTPAKQSSKKKKDSKSYARGISIFSETYSRQI